MKKLFVTSALFSAITIYAQDPFFTQQNYGLSFINPAYAGASAGARAEMGYRLQWPAISGTFHTFNAAYDQSFAFGGLGFNYTFDAAGQGTILNNRFDLNYAYGFGIGQADDGKPKFVLQPGVQVSYFRKSIDWTSLTFGDQIDPRRGFVYNTSEAPASGAVNCFDVSAGLLAYSKRISFGFSTFHLNEPDEGFIGSSRLPMRFVVHASGILGNAEVGGEGFSFVPSVVYMQQQNSEMLVAQLTAKYRGFSLGGGYRDKDAVLFTAGYTNGNIAFGYSYDLTVSKLTTATGGSHELHVGYYFLKDQWSSRRSIQMFL